MEKPRHAHAKNISFLAMACVCSAVAQPAVKPVGPVPNPILNGADPHAVWSGRDFLIYATHLGGTGPSQLHAASSLDLTDWKMHGPLIDFAEIPWIRADGRRQAFAWAPCVARKGDSWFLYYSVGPQSPGFPAHIGVAVGNSPLGRFKDSGKPLLTGGDGFEAIDPMVYQDPATGKWLLYAGGSAGAKLRVFELAEDMVSVAREIQVQTPPQFTEGPFLHHHGGVYHLTYSHGSWRHGNYSVHHATAPSPGGPWEYRGVILASDARHKGPGHHSILRKPGSDDWMIFYHRWEHARGDGPYQGTRMIAADLLVHLPGGGIKPVVMTDRKPLAVDGGVRPLQADGADGR